MINKTGLYLALVFASSALINMVFTHTALAEQSSSIGTEGIGGTGAKPGDDGFGGTGRTVDMQRPELPERPEFIERPEFERPENIERNSALDLDAAEAVDDLPASGAD